MRVGERQIELDGWPGMVGHNWGAQHAERWIWMHGAGFEGTGATHGSTPASAGSSSGRSPRRGSVTRMLSLDGERHRLGGPERVRSTKIGATPESCEFRLTGKDIEVRGTVRAPRARTSSAGCTPTPTGRSTTR